MTYDCIQFFNELDLLELRLEYLDSVVDRFIIIEATQTHAGKPKPLIFKENESRFSAFFHKINYFSIDFPFFVQNGIEKDKYQRATLMKGLSLCMPNDIIIVSDLDEFPKKEIIERMKVGLDGMYGFVHWMHYFYINRIDLSRKWIGASIAPYWFLTQNNYTPDTMRDLARSANKSIVKGYVEGGWHFSWLGGAEKIKYKMENYAHYAEDHEFCTQDNIINTLNSDDDLLRKGVKHKIVSIDSENLPEIIRTKQDKLKQLGWLI